MKNKEVCQFCGKQETKTVQKLNEETSKTDKEGGRDVEIEFANIEVRLGEEVDWGFQSQTQLEEENPKCETKSNNKDRAGPHEPRCLEDH
ncbi:hypothetical protein QQP08_010434 [Theobroma cacao]|nr:hypothetical protein QQP08_010434 [Theobroma cacao]